MSKSDGGGLSIFWIIIAVNAIIGLFDNNDDTDVTEEATKAIVADKPVAEQIRPATEVTQINREVNYDYSAVDDNPVERQRSRIDSLDWSKPEEFGFDEQERFDEPESFGWTDDN